MTHHNKEIQVKEKQEVTSPEQTAPGPYFVPAVDIFENEKDITLLADLPGVAADGLTIDLREDVLTLIGETSPLGDDGEEQIVFEYNTGKYYRQFSLSDIIDQEKIDAVLKDGVLRLTLPKAEKAKPRKIAITA